jgi:hypothetical protein
MSKPRSLPRSPVSPFRGAQGWKPGNRGTERRMNSVDYKSGEPSRQGGSHEQGKAGTREGGMQEMEWSGKVVD